MAKPGTTYTADHSHAQRAGELLAGIPVDRPLRDSLRAVAAREGVSVPALIRRLLDAHTAAQGVATAAPVLDGGDGGE